MYNATKNISVEFGNWLGSMPWDTFSTITYKFDINAKRNRKIMTGIERRLNKLNRPHRVFWVMEHTYNSYQTHNHLLLHGEGVKSEIDLYLKENNLVNDRFVRHIDYDSTLGANYYVSKYISSNNIDYDISFNE